ncbi:START domain [Sesbania bispinosa]|nr:START domain [Sesbania bispinosa]
MECRMEIWLWIFEKCQHPDDQQRSIIAAELGLEPKQVKFWFQNKRTQVKTQLERADNTTLRLENSRLRSENDTLKEALKNYEKVTKILHSFMKEDPKSSQAPDPVLRLGLPTESSMDPSFGKSLTLAMGSAAPSSSALPPLPPRPPNKNNPTIGSSSGAKKNNPAAGIGSSSGTAAVVQDANVLPTLPPAVPRARTEAHKARLLETARAAKEELVKLMWTNEPLWIKSSSADKRLVLDPENYQKYFTRANNFTLGCKSRVETSKDSRIVKIHAIKLVDMLLDTVKWGCIFSTIITNTQSMEVIEVGSPQNRSGSLQMIYEEMHVLSPLVPHREFYLIRYCEQVKAGIWVIVNVSFDPKKEGHHASTRRFPSGCLIHQISDTSSEVIWVEHVEVDAKVETHKMYREVVNNGFAYGAERWLMELERTSERINCVAAGYIPMYDTGVVASPDGRKSVMRLSHKMVRKFCGSLIMTSKVKFPAHFDEEAGEHCTGVRTTIRKNQDPNLPNDIVIITVSTSFWLPIPSQNLFNFFKDPLKRPQWDALCDGNGVIEIAHIANGTHPNNYISIMQPMRVGLNDVVILQESFIDPLGAYVVYSPINMTDLKTAATGGDSSAISVLPSGITISEDRLSSSSIMNIDVTGKGKAVVGSSSTRGSLSSISFQILMSASASENPDSMPAVTSLITSTIQNIKEALI